MPDTEPREIAIRGDMIRLGQLLKHAGLIGMGSDAKGVLATGGVSVNGEREERRGRQLHDGDVIALGPDVVRISAAGAAPTP